jgi:hypothetical protein
MTYQDGSIAHVTNSSNDKIFYLINEPNSYRYKDAYDEPYAKALEIVRAKDREKAAVEKL